MQNVPESVFDNFFIMLAEMVDTGTPKEAVFNLLDDLADAIEDEYPEAENAQSLVEVCVAQEGYDACCGECGMSRVVPSIPEAEALVKAHRQATGH